MQRFHHLHDAAEIGFVELILGIARGRVKSGGLGRRVNDGTAAADGAGEGLGFPQQDAAVPFALAGRVDGDQTQRGVIFVDAIDADRANGRAAPGQQQRMVAGREFVGIVLGLFPGLERDTAANLEVIRMRILSDAESQKILKGKVKFP